MMVDGNDWRGVEMPNYDVMVIVKGGRAQTMTI
jgi:hypothetical protein